LCTATSSTRTRNPRLRSAFARRSWRVLTCARACRVEIKDLIDFGVLSSWRARKSDRHSCHFGRFGVIKLAIRILHAETTRGGGSSRPRYFHTVRYSYVVDNNFFTGDRIAFMFDRGTTDNTLQFSTGQRVPVYYDPLNPSSSVLLKGIQPYYLFVTGLGFVFVTIGWLVFRYLPGRNFSGR
jgi:Protein of unknown function (DUF3592)